MTFTWIPDYGASGTVTPNVSKVQYGDGYEQRQAIGLNTLPESWPLAFTKREGSEPSDILAFLSARGGLESFDWTTPLGDAVKVVCRQWTKVPQPGARFDITATFDEVFEP